MIAAVLPSLVELGGVAGIAGAAVAAVLLVTVSRASGSENAMGHRCVFVAALPLAIAAGLFLASMPGTLAGYAQAAIEADGTSPHIPFVSPWLGFLAKAGFIGDAAAAAAAERTRINASFDFTFDVVCIQLCLVAAYAGSIVTRQLVVTVRLLKAHRRLTQHHDVQVFSAPAAAS